MARCDSYVDGQCTRGACLLADWVPDGWGNAIDWLGHAQAQGFGWGETPTVGAIVVYFGGALYSQLGHLALVEAVLPFSTFLVKEMNFTAPFVYDERISDLTEVAGFILPPGVRSGGSPADLDPFLLVNESWNNLANFFNQTIDEDLAGLIAVDSLIDNLSRL